MDARGEVLRTDRARETVCRARIPDGARRVVERARGDVALVDVAEAERLERVDARVVFVVAFVRHVAAEDDPMRQPRKRLMLESHARRGASQVLPENDRL